MCPVSKLTEESRRDWLREQVIYIGQYVSDFQKTEDQITADENTIDKTPIAIRLQDDLSIELAVRCFEKGMEDEQISREQPNNEKPELSDFLLQACRRAQLYWEDICTLIKQMHPDTDPQFLGFIPFMKSVVSEMIQEGRPAAFTDGLNNALNTLVSEIMRANDSTSQADVSVKSDEEIKQLLDQADEDTLRDFFETFKDLKVVHRDPSLYETDEERDKWNHLFQLYRTISGQ